MEFAISQALTKYYDDAGIHCPSEEIGQAFVNHLLANIKNRTTNAEIIGSIFNIMIGIVVIAVKPTFTSSTADTCICISAVALMAAGGSTISDPIKWRR